MNFSIDMALSLHKLLDAIEQERVSGFDVTCETLDEGDVEVTYGIYMFEVEIKEFKFSGSVSVKGKKILQDYFDSMYN
jgi:hypothetical protein